MDRTGDGQSPTPEHLLAPRLTPWSRRLCAALGLLLLILGVVAVFLTDNEIGTGGLIVGGCAFALIGVMGYVPRMSWGSASLDPTPVLQYGERLGALKVVDQVDEALKESVDDVDAAQAVQAIRTDLLDADRPDRSAEVAAASHQSGDTAQLRSRLAPELLEILNRFAGFNREVDHERVAERMQDLGFIGHAPQTRGGASRATYVRWTFQGRRDSLTLYQNSAGLVSDRKSQLPFALTLEGADREGGVHPKVRFYYAASSVETVLAAADRLRAFADGDSV